jgi:hypothetical protein
MEPGVKTPTPYTLLLAEIGLLPLEVKALQDVMRVKGFQGFLTT